MKILITGGGGFLGKPYEPNAVIKNDIEFILMQRKPGGYRTPDLSARILSVILSIVYFIHRLFMLAAYGCYATNS